MGDFNARVHVGSNNTPWNLVMGPHTFVDCDENEE